MSWPALAAQLMSRVRNTIVEAAIASIPLSDRVRQARAAGYEVVTKTVYYARRPSGPTITTDREVPPSAESWLQRGVVFLASLTATGGPIYSVGRFDFSQVGLGEIGRHARSVPDY